MESSPKSDTCVVCCRDIKVFAVGSCDHPICHVCSTRLRVLCRQNDCPICRRDLPNIFFSSTLYVYKDASSWKQNLFNYRYKICFENEVVQSEYYQLLGHSCEDCTPVQTFKNFKLLMEHARKSHEKFFCDLCVEHLHIFTHERKAYNRKDLARHRRIGDADDTSHRGHPLCKFCDKRFMDHDILFKHLRRDHFFCHFCDSSDVLNEYYGDYKSLRVHFKEKHFLCEEDKCSEEKFTSVFRSDIDLKAHKSQEHSRSMSKAQAKQTRTLEIEFAMAPRSSQNIGVIRPSDYSDINRVSHERKQVSRRNVPTSNVTTISAPISAPERSNTEVTVSQNMNMNFENDFPTIDGSSTSADLSSRSGKQNAKTLADKLATSNRFTVRNIVDDEEFPSLSSSATVQPLRDYPSLNGRPSNSQSSGSTARKIGLKANDVEDFPSLGKANPNKKTGHAPFNSVRNTLIKVNHKAPVSSSSTISHPTKPKWMSNSKNITLQNGNSVPINDSGGSTIQMHASARKKSSKMVPDSSEKNFPALSSSTATTPLQVKGAWKAEKKENNNVPFVTIKAKSKKGKKTNKTEENISDSDFTKKKKKGENAGAVDISSKNVKTSENQENIKPSLDLGCLSLKDEQSEIDKNCTDSTTIAKNNKNISKPEDFPELNPSQTPRVPPPGFSSSVYHKVKNVPPGFNSAAASVSQPISDVPSVTFTNSSGQDYSMSTTGYSYSEPDSFNERNQNLILTIKSVLKENNSSFDNFKKLSSDFRKDCLSAKEYYKKFIEIIGNSDYKKIFAELIVLLPDIEKQQQLLTVHNSFLKSQAASKGAKPKDNAWIFNDFVVCTACQQVLSKDDFRSHVIKHNLESNFPSLPSADGSNKLISWRKKS